MRRLQAGLFPEARRRIGKCFDCGEEGAVAGVGEGFGFLVVAGACADVREPLLATRTTKAKKSDRARKGMRLNESSAQRIPRGRRHAQIAIRANVSQFPSCRQFASKLVFPKKQVGLISQRCVAGVGGGVIDVVQSRHQMDFLATKLGFEDAEVLPWMVWFICRRNSP